ncbi:hypothetical protein [Colwellia sp. MEBiC06753]
MIDFSKLDYLQNPQPAEIPDSPLQWLHQLTSTTVIDFVNNEQLPWRAITTLLHGNEPSGFYALHQLIKTNAFENLAINVRVIIGSVEAAKYKPEFSQRFPSDGFDLNRCFGSTSLSHYYLRAQMIASSIRQVNPEAIIDLHNTSGDSPAFSVSCHQSHEHLALASLFCNVMIVTHIKLGALMELSFDCPVITVECGGAKQEISHELACQGLTRFLLREDLNTGEHLESVEVIYQPMRIKVAENCSLTYSNQAQQSNITMRSDIEQLNYLTNINGETIAWLDENGLANLSLEGDEHHGKLEDYFYLNGNQLICQQDMRLFMATSYPELALNDCLFYLARRQRF